MTVMALVSDAFGQQSVRYPLRKANNTATVPISQYYDRYGAGGAYPRNIDRNIEQSMTAAAIYDGALILIYLLSPLPLTRNAQQATVHFLHTLH